MGIYFMIKQIVGYPARQVFFMHGGMEEGS